VPSLKQKATKSDQEGAAQFQNRNWGKAKDQTREQHGYIPAGTMTRANRGKDVKDRVRALDRAQPEKESSLLVKRKLRIRKRNIEKSTEERRDKKMRAGRTNNARVHTRKLVKAKGESLNC